MGNFWFYVNLVLTAGLLPAHLALGPPRTRYSRIVLSVMILVWLIFLVYLSFQSGIRLRDVMLALASYSLALFVWCSEMLMNGGAAWLTRKRGERWTKEIDYVYLTLGVGGLITVLGQLQNVSDKLILPSMFAPFIVATAIVLRAIKTRAEIGGWNKPKE